MKTDTQRIEGQVDHVVFEGDLDYRVSAEVRSALNALPCFQGSKILVDLGKVHYMDSSGIAAFVELSQRLKRAPGKLAFCSLTDPVKSVFELAKMHLFFTITESKEEALQHLNA